MKKLLLILAILLLNNPTQAIEDIKKVNLDEAIDIALENNIDLKAAQLNIKVAKNEEKVANRLQNPSIDGFYFLGAAGWSEPKQWGLSQNIEIAKRNARKKLAQSNLKLVEKNTDYTTFDLKMDVREAYINLVASKSIQHTLEQQQDLQEELLQIAKNHVKAGKVPEIDAIQAEIALNQLITQVNTAKVNVKQALSNFNKVINSTTPILYDSNDKIFAEENNYKEMLTPNPTLNFPSISTLMDKALANRLDIQIAKQQIDIAEKNLTLVSRQRIPDLSISGGYAYQIGAHSDDGRFHNGAYAGASLVNIPLFYNYSPEIQNATIKLHQAELNYTSTKNKAIKDITVAYERFLTAADNLNQYEAKIVAGSEKLIDISLDSYEHGKSDLTSLIIMKQSYKSIIVGYTLALADYYNSWTNFLREINDEDFEINLNPNSEQL
ncbi:TolC family protein [bacterium]|nr:TolC family protein [bacterium]